MNFSGVGVFFNQMYDLERIKTLPIDWIAPIMAPDQESVQLNRREWTTWRNAMPNVKFCPWIVCEDPELDAQRIEYVLGKYPSDGLVLNCEKAYESDGRWKALPLMNRLATITALPKLLSPPSSPAEIFSMDYRSFERAGCVFAPQAYWNEFPDATPANLWRSTYLPSQLHVGWDYRLQVYGVVSKRWSRVVSWNGDKEAVVQDLVSSKLYRVPVVHQTDPSGYNYMTIDVLRKFYDYKTGKTELGKVLGFQIPARIMPTVGIYEVAGRTLPTPAEVKFGLNLIPKKITGASIYLGEYGWSSDYIKAVREALND